MLKEHIIIFLYLVVLIPIYLIFAINIGKWGSFLYWVYVKNRRDTRWIKNLEKKLYNMKENGTLFVFYGLVGTLILFLLFVILNFFI